MSRDYKIEPKPAFLERMKLLLGEEYEKFVKSLEEKPFNSIRANELKISPAELKKRLEEKGWKIRQPFAAHKEVMIIEGKIFNEKTQDNYPRLDNRERDKVDVDDKKRGDNLVDLKKGDIIPLAPGELGRALEHLLGYYYVQEISSMLPVLALNPQENERVLDLCASPGSKTTQIASAMKNKGTLVANEVDFGRMRILSSNLERCGAGNVIITRADGAVLCDKLSKEGFTFDKILVDAPCSGEGNLRTNPKTAVMWNPNGIKKMSFIQKRLLASAIQLLKIGGELVYSTCTFAPEEDEEVIDFVLKEFKNEIKIESVKLPLKCRQGILKWQGTDYNKDVQKSCRIYPFDDNAEGFFVAKFRRVK